MEVVGLGVEEVTSLRLTQVCHLQVVFVVLGSNTLVFFIFKAKEEDFDTWV